MLRTFDEHVVRPVVSLDGLWDFVTETERCDKGSLPRTYNRKLLVPGAWECTPGLENYRGRGWLRRSITVHCDSALRLVFGGVSHTGTVYLDGKKVGSHYDAFTPFEVIMPALKTGEHELVVEVDNSFGPHSALHLENDYYTYGGITRPVVMESIPAVYIARLTAVPKQVRGRWQLSVQVALAGTGPGTTQAEIIVHCADKRLDLGTVSIKKGQEQVVSGTLECTGLAQWSSEHPSLHVLTAQLVQNDIVVDDYIDRVGLRTVKVSGKKLLLNGDELLLKGFNRHEDHPQFGNVLPLEAMMNDLAIIKDLGCNCVRTSHYPNDMRFLDLCDELGVYVWEESHSRQTPFDNPLFLSQIEISTREMVRWHFNRPCIVIWGCLNECASHVKEGRPVFAHVLGVLKELDSSRPVTYASMHGQRDICYDLADIVSWNRYDGWYGGGIPSIEPAIGDMMKWVHGNVSTGGKGKPVIMSEFGAGALYGNHQNCRSPWSEEYQQDLLDESLRVYLNTPGIVGALIWQYCDVRVTRYWDYTKRPRTMNNKGVVDEYRRRKLAYETVKKRMHEAADRSR